MRDSFKLRRLFLPGIIPRIMDLFHSGFGLAAFYMALVYRSARLLPAAHPYLNPDNISRFGLRQVITEASKNLVFKKENIDQILIFFLILGGVVLLLMQIVLLVLALLMAQPALASSVADLFFISSTYNSGPANDIAFIMLDLVFGVEGIFNSCISDSAAICNDEWLELGSGYPSGFHLALHAMLSFYSFGLFVIAVMIIIYFVIALVSETAKTGSPFGERANKTWFPVRLILFFALLVPLNTGGGADARNAGLNAAQLAALWSAKFGSNFATNAWVRFNEDLFNSYGADSAAMIGRPNIPEANELLRFMYLLKSCKIAEEMAYDHAAAGGVQPYLVRNVDLASGATTAEGSLEMLYEPFSEAVKFSRYDTISIVYGVRDSPQYDSHRGSVLPVCGEITLPVPTGRISGAVQASTAPLQAGYYDLLVNLWLDPALNEMAVCAARSRMPDDPVVNCDTPVTNENIQNIQDDYNEYLNESMRTIVESIAADADWQVPQELKDMGWAAAAVWYNRIAELNGEITSAVLNMPEPAQYPIVMDKVARARSERTEHFIQAEAFNPNLPDGQVVYFDRARDRDIAYTLYHSFDRWGGKDFQISSTSRGTGNLFLDAVNWIFGTAGIFDMRQNADVHPMAQLSSLGRAMMDATVRNFAIGLGGKGVSKILDDFLKELSKAAGSFFMQMATVSFTLSFMLYYVLPIIPFIYFFFAAVNWLKSVFEAMVGTPLWALAHITRIDGQGIPGSAAVSGYILLLEIFVRPIMIVIGFIASMTLFAALIRVLNEIFSLAVYNTAGFNFEDYGSNADFFTYLRGPIDEFFYTAVYVVLAYLIALNTFKLIDQVPAQILRWMGAAVKSFADLNDNPAQKDFSGLVYKGMEVSKGEMGGGQLALLIT